MWGSISIAQSLIDAALIDEYRLVICPVVLESGRHLFRDDMKLLNAGTMELGAVGLKYASQNGH